MSGTLGAFGRHPYTNAYDLIRETVGRSEGGSCKLSRSDCAHIMETIGEATGISKEGLCIKLSEAFLRKYNSPLPADSVKVICAVCGNHEPGMYYIGNQNYICPSCASSI